MLSWLTRKDRLQAVERQALANRPMSAALGISALPMPMPLPDRCRSDEVTGHERRGRGWGASRCHPDQEIPPHPLQVTERLLLTSATHRSLPYSLSPRPLRAAKPDEKGGNPVAPCTFQLKATTLYWGRAKLPAHGQGCCRNSPRHPDRWRIFFRSVLKESYWCFFTALEPGWTVADRCSKKQAKAARGCSPGSGSGELAPASPSACSGRRRGTSVWTTGTHLGSDFSQGLQPGSFLQQQFYYPRYNPQTSSSPSTRSPTTPTGTSPTASPTNGAPTYLGHLQHHLLKCNQKTTPSKPATSI